MDFSLKGCARRDKKREPTLFHYEKLAYSRNKEACKSTVILKHNI